MTHEEFTKQMAEIPTTELCEMADNKLSELCKTGAQSFTMTVPPRTTDTDMIFSEAIRRLKAPNIIELEAQRLEWSLQTFTEATPISSLRKLESEIAEIEETINAGKPCPIEYADALMCLFDSASRAGITPLQIFEAFEKKLTINKARQWNKNPDNSYSHVKG